MRRSSLGFLFVALALLLRIAAPTLADARGFDPLTDAPICSHTGSTTAPDNNGSAGSHDKQLACDQMCCHIAPLAFAPPAVAVALLRVAVSTDQPLLADCARSSHDLKAHRARGPPFLS